MNKTFADFFGQSARFSYDTNEVTFQPFEVLTKVAESTNSSPSGLPDNPNHVIAALMFTWFIENYTDSETGVRLSQDKTVPIVSMSEKPRVALTDRQGEKQYKYDFTFSVYAKADSSFQPGMLVEKEGESREIQDGTPSEE